MTSTTTLKALAAAAIIGIMGLTPSPVSSRYTTPPGMAKPRGPVDPSTCTICHADVKSFDVVHGPVAVNACAACHIVESARDHTFRSARPGPQLCTYCHDTSFEGSAVIHEPVANGECMACHHPHGGSSAMMLKAPTTDELCATCHGDIIGANRHVHGPVAIGACTVCHLPHASSHSGLLSAPARDLCMECHVTIESQIQTHRVIHQPAAGDCTVCHDPHASDQPMMLPTDAQTLCLSCHESVKHTIETAKTQHAAVTQDRACLNCHDAHSSDHASVLRKDTQSLCFECHDREITLDHGVTLGNMKEKIETSTSFHGPVAQGNCAACHMIHGGDHFRLLAREYPPEFYAPFAEERYALCFSCHDKHLVLDQKTTAITDFRNGDLNLHFVHVNRETKGRSCRTCHETHASTQPNHIRKTVPFGRGGWELPIGFEKTISGGSCAPGCHSPYDYDRNAPVEYPGQAQPALWPEPEPRATPAGSGGSP